jgi:hypothetical protein
VFAAPAARLVIYKVAPGAACRLVTCIAGKRGTSNYCGALRRPPGEDDRRDANHGDIHQTGCE